MRERLFAIVVWSVPRRAGRRGGGTAHRGARRRARRCAASSMASSTRRPRERRRRRCRRSSPRAWRAGRRGWRLRRSARRSTSRRGARVRLLVPGDPEWPAGWTTSGDHAPLLPVGARRPARRSPPRSRRSRSSGRARRPATASTSRWSSRRNSSTAASPSCPAPPTASTAWRTARPWRRAARRWRCWPAASTAPTRPGTRNLLERIASAGAVVSEVPCGAAPTKWRFLQRNRLIAALGQATVVVEAGWRSGSLNTAGHAAALGRPLGAVPGPVTSAASAGCHRLLREFDARCVTTVDEVMELLGRRGVARRRRTMSGGRGAPGRTERGGDPCARRAHVARTAATRGCRTPLRSGDRRCRGGAGAAGDGRRRRPRRSGLAPGCPSAG